MTDSVSKDGQKNDNVNWSAPLGVSFALAVFFGSQVLVGLLFGLYIAVCGQDKSTAATLLESSVIVQFLAVLAIESLTVSAILWFVKQRKTQLTAIGLNRPKLEHLLYGLAGLAVYLPLIYFVVLPLVHALIPAINFNQRQDISFSSSASGPALFLVFLSLVVLPPIAEEILCRGLLYTSFRKNLPKISAAILTSVLFAAAHLQFGSGHPLLWVAAIDTFVLSMVLVYIRDKTNSLWPTIFIHSVKNLLAFLAIFVFHLS